MKGAPLPGTLTDRWIFRGLGVEGSVDGCFSLSWGPIVKPGEGVHLQETVGEWKEGSGNGASLFMGAQLGEPGGVKEGSGDGHIFPWGPHWETWDRAHMPGVYVWKKVLGWV
jgi:hypothetical protein